LVKLIPQLLQKHRFLSGRSQRHTFSATLCCR
jgi:hypothetical protein